MLEDASNRELVDAWQRGDQSAAQILVRRYMARLTALARSRLSRKLARRLDSEDVVMSAWRSFFTAVGRDQVAVPGDDNLWPLLVTLTRRKLTRQAVRHSADRRSVHSESDRAPEDEWPGIVANDPTPEHVAVLTDDLQRLMSVLSETDRRILTLRLQGEEQEAIADEVGCSVRTVRRSLQRIREDYIALADCPMPAELTGEKSEPLRSSSVPRKRVSGQPTSHIRYDDLTLHELIGAGGFGKVYRATLLYDGQLVAAKFLRKSFWRNAAAAEQLIHEVDIVTNLSHPGILQQLGWGKTARGAIFTVMEWVDGTNLEDWGRNERLTIRDVLACGLSVCDALVASHHAGVVHADLTPRNVLRHRDGRFLLTDFGFSRRLSEPAHATAGGTPGFLAPEQLTDAFGRVSPRTDIFGVGGLLYFLLTNGAPVTGRDIPETIARTLSVRPVRPVGDCVSGLPSALQRLVGHCLGKEPASRPQTVEWVQQQLQSILDKLE